MRTRPGAGSGNHGCPAGSTPRPLRVITKVDADCCRRQATTDSRSSSGQGMAVTTSDTPCCALSCCSCCTLRVRYTHAGKRSLSSSSAARLLSRAATRVLARNAGA
ncbi:MAG: hypothetical protein A3E25_09295 [Burkholderiales bacterium RIFCSPHIGHO2_12_FULL_69_20]|nr:MAG: hypothetical protein A3E25_09295 [Burkholderiales bacterium RIFCSPHIGHO2_12_FULL_69_20]